jgi:hypothetical protein
MRCIHSFAASNVVWALAGQTPTRTCCPHELNRPIAPKSDRRREGSGGMDTRGVASSHEVPLRSSQLLDCKTKLNANRKITNRWSKLGHGATCHTTLMCSVTHSPFPSSFLIFHRLHWPRVGIEVSPSVGFCSLLSLARLLLLPLSFASSILTPRTAPDETPVHVALRVETRRATSVHTYGHRLTTACCPFDPPTFPSRHTD